MAVRRMLSFGLARNELAESFVQHSIAPNLAGGLGIWSAAICRSCVGRAIANYLPDPCSRECQWRRGCGSSGRARGSAAVMSIAELMRAWQAGDDRALRYGDARVAVRRFISIYFRPDLS